MERAMRIELTTEAWEAPILPLNYARLFISYDILLYFWFFDKRLEAIKKYFMQSRQTTVRFILDRHKTKKYICTYNHTCCPVWAIRNIAKS